MPAKPPGLTSAYDHLQITGARPFNIKEDFSSTDTDLPNMLPTPEQFERSCRRIGINNASTVVVYDNRGIYFSPRVWWMFHTMGHQEVYVLDGGLPEWIELGFATEDRSNTGNYAPGNFTATLRPQNVKHYADIKAHQARQDQLIVDARSSGRFRGEAPEPRPGLPSGNIPNSINVPYTDMLDGGKLKTKEAIGMAFTEAGVDERPLIFSCGSGITACILLLASEGVLDNDKAVYDGSWTEWATRELL